MFRRIRIDEAKLSSSDDSILLSPVNGRARVKTSIDDKSIVTIKIGLFRGYGVAMPFNGEVVSHIETNEQFKVFGLIPSRKVKNILVLKSREFGEVKVILIRPRNLLKSKIWVRSGDKGLAGAYIGYMPFAGKVVIEMKKSVNILLKEKGKVAALSTLIASNRN